MATLAFAAGGAILGGAIFQGTAYAAMAISIGWTVGSLIGSWLFGPSNNVQGPRLTDLKVSSSAYGQAIPLVWGSYRVAVNIIWATDLVEVKKKQSSGGKGGGGGSSATTFTYFMNVAGAAVSAEIPVEAWTKVWFDSKVVWDESTGFQDKKYKDKLRFYNGGPTQMPDPLIEQNVGVGNTPAYRHLAYLVADRFPLKNFGNRVPNITVELNGHPNINYDYDVHDVGKVNGKIVFNAASINPWDSNLNGDYLFGFGWGRNDGELVSGSTIDGRIAYRFDTSTEITTIKEASDTTPILPIDGTITINRFFVSNYNVNLWFLYTTGWPGHSLNTRIVVYNWSTNQIVTSSNVIGPVRHFVDHPDYVILHARASPTGAETLYIINRDSPGTGVGGLNIINTYTDFIPNAANVLEHTLEIDKNKVLWLRVDEEVASDPYEQKINLYSGPVTNAGAVTFVRAEWIDLIDEKVKTLSGYDPLTFSIFAAYYNSKYHRMVFQGFWENFDIFFACVDLTTQSLLWHHTYPEFQAEPLACHYGNRDEEIWILGYMDHGGISAAETYIALSIHTGNIVRTFRVQEDVSGNRPYTDPFDDFFPNGYLQNGSDVDSSLILPDLNKAYQLGQEKPGFTNYNTSDVFFEIVFGAEGASTLVLSTIINKICDIVKIPASKRDTSELTDTVIGFGITRVTNAKNSVLPLQQVFFFDGVESEGKLKFPKRGKPPVVTIPQDDLAARDADENSDIPRVKEIRRQEIEIPRALTLTYIDGDKDYQNISQRAARHRDVVEAQDEMTAEIPVVMTHTFAAKATEKLLNLQWASRTIYEFTTSFKYIYLDPGDVVQVTSDGFTHVIYITEMNVGTNYVLEFKGQSIDNAVYTASDVQGSGGGTIPGEEPVISVNTALMLDIPLLRDVDDNAGFYMVAGGDNFVGGSLFESLDNITFNEIARLDVSGIFGTATTALGNTTTLDAFDEVNTVTVSVNGELTSTTEDGVLAGINIFLVGNEILGAKTATFVSTGVYTLSGLLRGLQGTEWAVGLHAITDRVVLLVNDGSIINVGQSLSTMNTTKYYKFVDDGLVVDDTQSVIFTNTNVRLKPLSVANVTGTRDGSDNLIIEWDDRLRFGHAWGDSEFPTDEPELEFEVDVMDGSTVVRTITTTSTTASYTAAEQTTDFGSPQNPLTVKIYKISSRVGRGYVKEASI